MPAGKLNLYIEKGATFRQAFYYATGTPPENVDLSGFTARMQIRAPGNTPGVSGGAILISLTTENGGVTLNADAEDGKVELHISALETEGLAGTAGVYDFELVNGAEVTRVLQGEVTLSPEVTRP